jgi:hypothetical protein
MATATFQAEGHLYQEDGVTIPSVTQVLTLSGIDDVSGIPIYRLERAAAIGRAVHEACHYLDEDDLDLDSVHPEIVGYCLGYQRFKEQTGFSPRAIEQRGIGESNGLRFGYCVDRLGQFDGREVLLDLKTASKKQSAWAIQTAGYAEGVEHNGPRIAVHLAKDGSYKLVRHEDPSDFETWRAALTVAHWKLNHGGKLPR